jgi:hypothetical protein
MPMSILLLWMGCHGSPTEAIGWREQWELLVLTEDGGLIDGRATVSNTGVLRGQGHLRVNRWTQGGTPIFFSMDGGPADVDVADAHDAVRVGSALLGRYEEGPHWTLRLSAEEAHTSVHVNPGGPQPPMATEMDATGQWTIASPITMGLAHGWFTAGKRGGIFEGRAVALHRGGDSRPDGPRTASFVMGNGVAIGFDQQGDHQLLWAQIRDQDLVTEDAKRIRGSDGTEVLDFRPSADLVVRLSPTGVGGTTDGFSHLYMVEKWFAGQANLRAERTVQRATVQVEFKGEQIRTTGVMVRVD